VIQHLLGEKHKVLILDQAECSSRISRQPLPQGSSMYIIEVRAASYVHKEYVVNKGE
ncbi:hypothetical protein K402DRAFT_399204, partial [Aulographum hederae CBS 113979]